MVDEVEPIEPVPTGMSSSSSDEAVASSSPFLLDDHKPLSGVVAESGN